MGWARRPNTHSLARDLKGDRGRRRVGFEKKGVASTHSVNPGTVDAHETAQIIVTVFGIAPSRWHLVIATPPAGLETGLVYRGCTITDVDEVTLDVENTTGAPIVAAPRNWTVTAFVRRATE